MEVAVIALLALKKKPQKTKLYLQMINSVHLHIETIVWGKICHYMKELKAETHICFVFLQPFLFVTVESSESKVK